MRVRQLIFIGIVPMLGACDAASVNGCGRILRAAEGATIELGTNRRPLSSGDVVAPGELIRTASEGHPLMMLAPTTVVQLSPGTSLRAGPVTIVKDGDETDGGMKCRTSQVDLLSGAIAISHEKPRHSDSSVVVTTPRTRLEGRSECAFKVRLRGEEEWIFCATGHLRAVAENRRHDWYAGYLAIVRADGITVEEGQADFRYFADFETIRLDAISSRRWRDALRNRFL